MTGGISAISGFDYQAVVILDKLLAHFKQFGDNAEVRPEGIDDLDLYSSVDAVVSTTHVQIKKPKENIFGIPSPSPWTLGDAIKDLFPKTIAALSGNENKQEWILGDKVTPELHSLIGNSSAQLAAMKPYFVLVHKLAFKRTFNLPSSDLRRKRKLERWWPSTNASANFAEGLNHLLAEFTPFALKQGLLQSDIASYQQAAEKLNSSLPSILGRITIVDANGQDHEVKRRVCVTLEQRYGLSRKLVEHTLFRNLRGFINDIAKQPDRRFDCKEFETEIVNVWPTMIAVKMPPSLAPHYISRADIATSLICSKFLVVEVVGASGSGKSSLAAEAIARFEEIKLDNLAYYIEVRRETTFRNVLVGIAFRLRRVGVDAALGLATDDAAADEQVTENFARLLPSLQRPVVLFLDLVDGGCDESFSRELANFVRMLGRVAHNLRLVILGQERALRNMSDFERESLKIGHVDVRGFDFDEFKELVIRNNPEIDCNALYGIFERITAGRSAGIIARLAMVLAQMDSVAEMETNAMLTPEKMLIAADRARFMRVSASAQQAAAKLVCIALPFRRGEAMQIFPDDKIGAAIHELLCLGLLRSHDGDTFEMHETIRAGLEDEIAIADRRNAHCALAEWYCKKEDLVAEIFHLDKAGSVTLAHQKARTAFLNGMQWNALLAYIIKHKLVSGDEAVSLAVNCAQGGQFYLLPDLFASYGNTDIAEKLLNELTLHFSRCEREFSWTLAMLKSILQCDPRKISPILELALKSNPGSGMLGFVQLAIMQAGVRWDTHALNFFRKQHDDEKLRILPLLLRNGWRDSLAEAFTFLMEKGNLLSVRNENSWAIDSALCLTSHTNVVEFLAALPLQKVSDMLVHRSVLLEPFAALIWSQRLALNQYSVAILESGLAESAVMENAIRVLVCLAEPRLLQLCELLPQIDSRLRALSSVLPAFVPWLADIASLEKRALDRTRTLEDRMAPINALTILGGNFAYLLKELQFHDQENSKMLEFMILLQCVQNPFEEALPLLIEQLTTRSDFSTLPALVGAFGRLQSDRITDFLIDVLAHDEAWVRLTAASALSRKRCERVLNPLVAQLENEDDSTVAQAIVTAIIASHPNDCVAVSSACTKFPSARLWYFLLAARLRDESASTAIIAAAIDKAEHWMVRRAAILAAGKLPFAAALAIIAPVVLLEKSSFECDQSGTLCGHEALAIFLTRGIAHLFPPFRENRDEFINFVGNAFTDYCKDMLFPDGIPSGVDAGTWLFECLINCGFPENEKAPDMVLATLYVPLLHASVLRSLRLCGRVDLIIGSIADAYSLWFAVRCVKEVSYARIFDPVIFEQVESAAKRSRFYSSIYFQRIVEEFIGTRTKTATVKSQSIISTTSGTIKLVLSNSDILNVLVNPDVDIDLGQPVVVDIKTVDEFKHLIIQLDPTNDFTKRHVNDAAALRLTSTGFVVGSGMRMQKIDNRADLRAALRPAIAAANKWGEVIPWHESLLLQDKYDIYIKRFFNSLVAQQDSARFFEELNHNEYIMMAYICNSRDAASMVHCYADKRMARVLSRFVASGADAFFKGLCTVTAGIVLPEIDAVLAALFERWIRRFDRTKKMELQHHQNHELWQAFDKIVTHPRFYFVPQWDHRLMTIMQFNMYDFQKDNIMRVLERSPEAYCFFEMELFRNINFENKRRDAVDILDEAAEHLFMKRK